MQLEIQALNFKLTEALHNYVKRKLGFTLSSRDEYIQRIIVHLTDINGPQGGKDKCCHIQIVLPQLSDVIIEDTEKDLYTAIDRAAERSGRTLGRHLERHRTLSRFPHQVKIK